ncbi:MAG: phosphonate dehydrogenase [Candidatus Methylomirabilia bacterium]
MSSARIVVTHRAFPETLTALGRHGTVVGNDGEESWDREALFARAQDADAIMVFMPDQVDAAFLERCPRLRIIACALKGYDNIDVEACTRRGVWASVVPDLLSVPTADLAVGLLLSLTRNVVEGDRFVRSGRFRGWRPAFYGRGLAGKTAGVVGFGSVGQLIARRLLAFDLRVLACDPALAEAGDLGGSGAEQADLHGLLESSDYVILAAPLLPSTLHLIDAGLLARMKAGAVLVNVGRGSVVDESAVGAALHSGALAGYAADVFEFEDLSRPDRPAAIPLALLQDRASTLFTPHLGSAVDEVRLRIEQVAAANIIDVLEGRPPRNAINRV